MRNVVIEDPIINSPFTEPGRHFRFDEEGITNDVRGRFSLWRDGGYPGVTRTTQWLLQASGRA